ncbi:MAG: bifunctional nuclease family protein [Candidatus Sumerlaeia bacterium]|nr:bifunctional nuclease family protein [Candidatus Sumerlaeia bacterium]
MIEMQMRVVENNFETRRGGVILAEKAGRRILRIYIGENEARAIDKALNRRFDRRPMTHDLIASIFEGLGVEILSVYIDELRDDTFFGKLVLSAPGEGGERRQVIIDSRPSDALALAARAAIPIFASEEVLDEAGEEMDL